jgi:hypothetical protein
VNLLWVLNGISIKLTEAIILCERLWENDKLLLTLHIDSERANANIPLQEITRRQRLMDDVRANDGYMVTALFLRILIVSPMSTGRMFEPSTKSLRYPLSNWPIGNYYTVR